MATKGQPSLTITHMGISKLPTTGGGIVSGSQAHTVAASLQGLSATVATNLSAAPVSIAGGVTPATASGNGGALNVVATGAGATVSLATTAGLLTTQNNITSAAGGATVVPLAITTRGGTITSIKSANGITVGKVMTAVAAANSPTSIDGSSGSNTPTNTASVFLQQQRSGSGSPAHSSSASSIASSVSSSTATSSIAASTTAYLPAGSAIYYESVPASNAAGALPITTTTLASSTMTSAATSGTNLSLTSATSTAAGLPFVTGGNTTTFTVVPTSSTVVSGAARAIGQLQLPITSAGGAQIQAVRFSTPLSTASSASAAVSVAETAVSQQALLMSGSGVVTSVAAQQQHMVIPLQTSIKVATAGVPGTTVVSNFIRKRENIVGSIDSSNTTLRAAKNLGPTLISMGVSPAASSPTSVSSTSSAMGNSSVPAVSATTTSSSTLASCLSPAPSTGSNFSTVSSSGNNNAPTNTAQSSSVINAATNLAPTTTTALTVEALAQKDRAAGLPRSSRDGSPVSSDGSTTVSANSSPGVERQIAQIECDVNGAVYTTGNGGNPNTPQHHSDNVSSTHFNPILELYPNHHQHPNASALENNASLHLCGAASSGGSLLVTAAMPQRLNGGMNADGEPPHKRSRRGTTDSQQSNQSQPSSSYSLNVNTGAGVSNAGGIDYIGGGSGTPINCNLLTSCSLQMDDNNSSNSNHSSTHQHKVHYSSNNPSQMPMLGNKENAKPVDYYLRRPRLCTLLNTYKANWKCANNHFQRHTDVKQREERRPTVIDIANQVNVQGKLGGWKIHHLSAQMEDLAENEAAAFEKITEMLKQTEIKEKTLEVEKICDLLKGNIQRNKIIVDGINEAKNQIMKIFEHQTTVSEILSRCASKRNFKKRDKV